MGTYGKGSTSKSTAGKGTTSAASPGRPLGRAGSGQKISGKHPVTNYRAASKRGK